MTPQQIAKVLSIIQRNLLIRHIDTIVPYIVAKAPVARVLMEHKLIKPASPGPLLNTALTVLGRMVACAILAEYAEALIAAGYEVSPLERLRSGQQNSIPALEHSPASEQVPEIIAAIHGIPD